MSKPTEIPLRHAIEGRWLVRVNTSDSSIVFRERAGNFEKVMGCTGILVGLVVSTAAIYCEFKYPVSWQCAALFAIGVMFVGIGAGRLFPRKGFAIDKENGQIAIWGLSYCFHRRAVFPLTEFSRVRVKIHMGKYCYPITLMTASDSVLPLMSPRREADAVALAQEIAASINLPLIQQLVDEEIDSDGAAKRYLKGLIEETIFTVS